MTMKKIILFFATVAIAVAGHAQARSHGYVRSPIPEEREQMDSLAVDLLDQIRQRTAPCYRLSATDDKWTFLELETFTGRIWQVKFSPKDPDRRSKTVMNENSLVSLDDDEGAFAGRFEIIKTQDAANFLLLDTSDGRTWQIQWASDPKDFRLIRILSQAEKNRENY